MLINRKPPRTIGISLAILLSVLFFSLFPFIQTGYNLILQDRIRQSQVIVGSNFNLTSSIDEISQYSRIGLVIEIIPPIIFFVLCFLTWVGKPSYIRHLFWIAVVSWVVGMWVRLYAVKEEPAFFVSSGFIHTIQIIYAIFSSIVGLYVVWYINRAPARAFFRGYYLQEPSADQES